MNEFNKSYTGLRPDLLKYIKEDNLIILDVGCANGVNGKYLLDTKKANVVYGIEVNEIMAYEASKINTKIYCGDLNCKKFRLRVIEELPPLDYIIFGDILEHLYDPEIILKDIKGKLKKGGRIIISLPNIAHIELFIQIYINGTWPKNDRGIFDKTHLRWFTKRDVINLVKCADLKLLTYEPKFRARDSIDSKFNWKFKILKKLNKSWVTFQHIILCEHV